MKVSEFFRKLQFVLMLTLGSYPVGTCLVAYIAPELVTYMWLLPCAFFAFCLLSFALPGKLRLALGVLGTVAMLAPSFLLENVNARNIMLTITLLEGGLLLWSTGIPGWDGTKELSMTWLGTCLTTLLVGCLLSAYEPRLAEISAGMRLCTLTFVFLAMLSLNRGSLNLASGGKQGFSKAMRRKNILLTVGMFAIAFLVALIPSLVELVVWLAGLVVTLIQKLAELFPEAEEVVETTLATVETTAATVGEEAVDIISDGMALGRTSNVTLVVMAVIVLAIMIPLSCYSMFVVGRGIWRGIRSLAGSILDAAQTEAEEFRDEITDTREDADSEYHRRREAAAQRKSLLAKLSPGEKIRYHYGRLRAKNPQWQDHTTARENLPEAAARIYERARYSDHPVTEADVAAFREKSRPKPGFYRDLEE